MMVGEEAIMIVLTEQQRKAVMNGEPVQLLEGELGTSITLLRTDAFEEIREILEDERTRRAVAKVAARNAVACAEEP
jgi:hypothetical protein